MSSKEQYKDLIKRLNQEIRDLKKENYDTKTALVLINRKYMRLFEIPINKQKKKWYQFWK